MCKSGLDEAWDNTVKAGEENGLFVLYSSKYNMVHLGIASQGTHKTDSKGNRYPAMPNFGRDFLKFKAVLRSTWGIKAPQYITDFHTHLKGWGDVPSNEDYKSLVQLGGEDAEAVIISGLRKYTVYNFFDKSVNQKKVLNQCRTGTTPGPPSIHIRTKL